MNEYLETLRELLRYYESRNNGSTDSQAKVNALRWAIAELEAREPPPNSVKVRIAIQAGSATNWAASGHANLKDEESAGIAADMTEPETRLCFLEGYAPLPEPPVTVQGRVVE